MLKFKRNLKKNGPNVDKTCENDSKLSRTTENNVFTVEKSVKMSGLNFFADSISPCALKIARMLKFKRKLKKNAAQFYEIGKNKVSKQIKTEVFAVRFYFESSFSMSF